MVARSALEIVNDYYVTLEEAFQTGQLNPIKLHLAQDAVLLGPREKFEGKKNLIEMYQTVFVPIIKRFEFIHQFQDKNAVCTVLDCIGKRNGNHVACTELIQVKDGLIKEIQLFYDGVQWESIK